jgi:hypothetical protein
VALSAVEEELIEMLRKVQRRPGLFLGGVSLGRLSAFITGYLCGRLRPDEKDPPLLRKFAEWLRSDTGIDKEAGWQAYIRFYAIDGQSGVEEFFRQFEAFLSDVQQKENS